MGAQLQNVCNFCIFLVVIFLLQTENRDQYCSRDLTPLSSKTSLSLSSIGPSSKAEREARRLSRERTLSMNQPEYDMVREVTEASQRPPSIESTSRDDLSLLQIGFVKFTLYGLL